MNTTAGRGELPTTLQWRNSLVFFANNSLTYLVAPVFYVGVLHAAILDSLEASDAVANLPEAVSLWVTPLPVLIAWLWPSPHLLRPMLATALVLMGSAGFMVAGMCLATPRAWLIPALVAHAAIIGIANGVRQMCLWELIGRGLSPERRGWTLGWTFGLGPVFAVAGSCATQLVLSGNFLEVIRTPALPAPWKYVALFGATGPAMWLAAALVALAHVPADSSGSHAERSHAERGNEDSGSPTRGADVRDGLRQYFLQPLILVAAVAFVLTYGGTMIMNNLSLFAREAIGESPERYAGLQLALRFGCKCLAGFALGWLVVQVHAKATLLATSAACLAGVCWALVVPGKWYLLSFGLLGAGELFYVYYLNYIVGCSSPDRIRENTAYTNLVSMVVGFLPVVFGLVSDRYGLRCSFVVALVMLALAIVIVGVGLPRQPQASAIGPAVALAPDKSGGAT